MASLVKVATARLMRQNSRERLWRVHFPCHLRPCNVDSCALCLTDKETKDCGGKDSSKAMILPHRNIRTVHLGSLPCWNVESEPKTLVSWGKGREDILGRADGMSKALGG